MPHIIIEHSENVAEHHDIDALVAAGDAADIDDAAEAATEAFGVWSATPGAERKQILHRIADLIEERAQQIAVIECVDTGQAIRFMSSAALRGAENFRFFADQAPARPTGCRCRRLSTSTTPPVIPSGQSV